MIKLMTQLSSLELPLAFLPSAYCALLQDGS